MTIHQLKRPSNPTRTRRQTPELSPVPMGYYRKFNGEIAKKRTAAEIRASFAKLNPNLTASIFPG